MEMQVINNCIPRENSKFSELLYKDQFKKVERDHCIVKLLGLKGVLNETRWCFLSSMSSNSTYTWLPSQMSHFRTIYKLESSWNEITWQVHKIAKFMSIIPLMKLCNITKLQWTVHYNLKTHFIILALDSVEKVKKNRWILTATVKSIKFCAGNGIAVRGHLDDGALNSNHISKESGNLKSLINSRIRSW